MGSSSSSETAPASALPSGTELAGFRIERVLGFGSKAVVYEATQLELDRPVALKLFSAEMRLEDRIPRLRWPEHPNAVALYAAGQLDDGTFLALQLVRGATLAHLLAAEEIDPQRARAWLSGVGEALDAAHADGSTHGAVTARNVFVSSDGRALLSDFGLGEVSATSEDDRAAFAALVEACGGRLPPGARPSSAAEIATRAFTQPRWRALVALGAVVALAIVVAGALVFARSSTSEAPPAVLPGTVALGSALPASGVRSVDCTGSAPNGASEACTVAQTSLAGRTVAADRSGVIRRWAVRGARGQFALEVIRRQGNRFFMVARTQSATVADAGLHVLPAYLPVRAGDLVGLEVTPGSAIGVRETRKATTARWFGPLVYSVRPKERGVGTGFDRELLLRVEYAPGARWRTPGLLTGRAADEARPGRVSGRFVLLPGPSASELVVARLGNRVVLDLVRGDRRLVRLVLLGAEADGQLAGLEFVRERFGRQIIRVSWQNPSGLVIHEYDVGARSVTPLK